MKNCEMTRKRISEHYERYPKMQIADLFKYLYQSAFGCEHMVSSEQKTLEKIRCEYAECGVDQERLVDALDGDYSRVHFLYLKKGLSEETFAKLFCLSAKTESLAAEELQKKLSCARELVVDRSVLFDIDEFDRELALWKKKGYSSLHHSEVFRLEYAPSYRVIANEYVRFLPLFTKIDEKLVDGSAIVAIDGGSASGKTTLSKMIESIYDCNVFHMDDFFLRPEQRTKERFAEIGGNVDRERFLSEVLLPLSRGEDINYRRFDCATQKIESPTLVKQKKLTVVEGAYSMHPELAPYYNLSVFLEIDTDYQKERILKRNTPELAKRFFEEWIPLENIYFTKTNMVDRCELTIKIKKIE